MATLGELEQVVLLAVLRVGREAYGVPVHEEIRRRIGRDISLGAIYRTLGRLDDKGLVSSHTGDPTPERGGRRTRCYTVTASGRRAVEASLRALSRLASGLDVGLEAP